MEIEQDLLKTILVILKSSPSHKMRLSELGAAVGLFTGNPIDPATLKLNESFLDKFYTHLKHLYHLGYIASSDTKLGITWNINGHVIFNSSVTYDLTPSGYTHVADLEKTWVSEIAPAALKTSNKIIVAIVLAFFAAIGSYIASLFLP